MTRPDEREGGHRPPSPQLPAAWRITSLPIAVAGLLSLGGPADAAAAGAAIAPRQELVALFADRPARELPASTSPIVTRVSDTRPITGARTTLPVLARTLDAGGRPWLKVRLPGRTLGRRPPPATGWIRSARTLRETTRWHIVVDTRRRRLAVFRDGVRLAGYRAIVGKSSTPTPLGNYFIEENVHLYPAQAGAPFALATSARSSVLQEFAGGPGQIAIHGRAHLGGTLGTAVSHGCIRLGKAAITRLAARIGPGTPVSIR